MPAMPNGRRSWARWVKGGLAALIVGGVAWQFARLLREPALWRRDWHLAPGWLAVAVATYAIGLGFWGTFWLRLLDRVGHGVPAGPGLRAYYVSHLGKYVPGKAWAILTRVSMLAGRVRPGVAALTATYETLTTMAAGALLAAVAVPFLLAGQASAGWQALGLFAVAGVPILPGVFNGLIARVTKPFIEPGDPLPCVPALALPEGLAWAGVGWCWLGASAWAVLMALGVLPADAGAGFVLRCVAFNALSYVAGFLFLPAPGGVGVREWILQQLLEREFAAWHTEAVAAGLAALAVVVLRLVWSAADLLNAAAAYALPVAAEGAPCSPS